MERKSSLSVQDGAPSPLSGAYMLVVVSQPRAEEHKPRILQQIKNGLLSWDETKYCSVIPELARIAKENLDGEEDKRGERLVQHVSEDVILEILIHPHVNTLNQCMRNLLSSCTKYKHVIHSGYTFSGNGSWCLQDGTYSFGDFMDTFFEPEVHRILKAFEDSIQITVHCIPEGSWSPVSIENEYTATNCQIVINPPSVISVSPEIEIFVDYISQFMSVSHIEDILEATDIVGTIRFNRPTVYVFPAGQGDCALFGVNGFTILIDGGFSPNCCFWDFVSHLDRLDTVLLTRINNHNLQGMNSFVQRKAMSQVYPQIGYFMGNIYCKQVYSDTIKEADPLLIDIRQLCEDIRANLSTIGLIPRPILCVDPCSPINLYRKVGYGALDMYLLNPSEKNESLLEFLNLWNSQSSKIFSQKVISSLNGRQIPISLLNYISVCVALVWIPESSEEKVTRLLFTGSCPEERILEALKRLRSIELFRYPAYFRREVTDISSWEAKNTLKDGKSLSAKNAEKLTKKSERIINHTISEVRKKKELPSRVSMTKAAVEKDKTARKPTLTKLARNVNMSSAPVDSLKSKKLIEKTSKVDSATPRTDGKKVASRQSTTDTSNVRAGKPKAANGIKSYVTEINKATVDSSPNLKQERKKTMKQSDSDNALKTIEAPKKHQSRDKKLLKPDDKSIKEKAVMEKKEIKPSKEIGITVEHQLESREGKMKTDSLEKLDEKLEEDLNIEENVQNRFLTDLKIANDQLMLHEEENAISTDIENARQMLQHPNVDIITQMSEDEIYVQLTANVETDSSVSQQPPEAGESFNKVTGPISAETLPESHFDAGLAKTVAESQDENKVEESEERVELKSSSDVYERSEAESLTSDLPTVSIDSSKTNVVEDNLEPTRDIVEDITVKQSAESTAALSSQESCDAEEKIHEISDMEAFSEEMVLQEDDSSVNDASIRDLDSLPSMDIVVWDKKDSDDTIHHNELDEGKKREMNYVDMHKFEHSEKVEPFSHDYKNDTELDHLDTTEVNKIEDSNDYIEQETLDTKINDYSDVNSTAQLKIDYERINKEEIQKTSQYIFKSSKQGKHDEEPQVDAENAEDYTQPSVETKLEIEGKCKELTEMETDSGKVHKGDTEMTTEMQRELKRDEQNGKESLLSDEGRFHQDERTDIFSKDHIEYEQSSDEKELRIESISEYQRHSVHMVDHDERKEYGTSEEVEDVPAKHEEQSVIIGKQPDNWDTSSKDETKISSIFEHNKLEATKDDDDMHDHQRQVESEDGERLSMSVDYKMEALLKSDFSKQEKYFSDREETADDHVEAEVMETKYSEYTNGKVLSELAEYDDSVQKEAERIVTTGGDELVALSKYRDEFKEEVKHEKNIAKDEHFNQKEDTMISLQEEQRQTEHDGNHDQYKADLVTKSFVELVESSSTEDQEKSITYDDGMKIPTIEKKSTSEMMPTDFVEQTLYSNENNAADSFVSVSQKPKYSEPDIFTDVDIEKHLEYYDGDNRMNGCSRSKTHESGNKGDKEIESCIKFNNELDKSEANYFKDEIDEHEFDISYEANKEAQYRIEGAENGKEGVDYLIDDSEKLKEHEFGYINEEGSFKGREEMIPSSTYHTDKKMEKVHDDNNKLADASREKSQYFQFEREIEGALENYPRYEENINDMMEMEKSPKSEAGVNMHEDYFGKKDASGRAEKYLNHDESREEKTVIEDYSSGEQSDDREVKKCLSYEGHSDKKIMHTEYFEVGHEIEDSSEQKLRNHSTHYDDTEKQKEQREDEFEGLDHCQDSKLEIYSKSDESDKIETSKESDAAKEDYTVAFGELKSIPKDERDVSLETEQSNYEQCKNLIIDEKELKTDSERDECEIEAEQMKESKSTVIGNINVGKDVEDCARFDDSCYEEELMHSIESKESKFLDRMTHKNDNSLFSAESFQGEKCIVDISLNDRIQKDSNDTLTTIDARVDEVTMNIQDTLKFEIEIKDNFDESTNDLKDVANYLLRDNEEIYKKNEMSFKEEHDDVIIDMKHLKTSCYPKNDRSSEGVADFMENKLSLQPTIESVNEICPIEDEDQLDLKLNDYYNENQSDQLRTSVVLLDSAATDKVDVISDSKIMKSSETHPLASESLLIEGKGQELCEKDLTDNLTVVEVHSIQQEKVCKDDMDSRQNIALNLSTSSSENLNRFDKWSVSHSDSIISDKQEFFYVEQNVEGDLDEFHISNSIIQTVPMQTAEIINIKDSPVSDNGISLDESQRDSDDKLLDSFDVALNETNESNSKEEADSMYAVKKSDVQCRQEDTAANNMFFNESAVVSNGNLVENSFVSEKDLDIQDDCHIIESSVETSVYDNGHQISPSGSKMCGLSSCSDDICHGSEASNEISDLPEVKSEKELENANIRPYEEFRQTNRFADATSSEMDDDDPIHLWGEPLGLLIPSSTPNKQTSILKGWDRQEKKNDDSAVYFDFVYTSHHSHPKYSSSKLFGILRSRYYVMSSTDPSSEVLNAILEGKASWGDSELGKKNLGFNSNPEILDITIMPTYEGESLSKWIAENEDSLSENNVNISPSASRCTVNIQEYEAVRCNAYRLEL